MTVDLHSHILPCIDDGARDHSNALEMLRIAVADGTRLIVATPHAEHASHDQIMRAVQALNTLAQDHALAITVLPGSELRLSSDLAARFQAGTVTTLNDTPYVLVELPMSGGWPGYVQHIMFDLRIAGAWPILAHAERYPALQRDPSLVAELVALGVAIQINADSLLGKAGKRAMQSAESLLDMRLAHVIASDAHDPRRRPPRLSAAINRAEQIAGSDYARLMSSFAAKIVDGEEIELPEPTPPVQQSMLRRVAMRVVGRGR